MLLLGWLWLVTWPLRIWLFAWVAGAVAWWLYIVYPSLYPF